MVPNALSINKNSSINTDFTNEMQSYVEHTFHSFIDIKKIQLSETVADYQLLNWNLIIEELEAENLFLKNSKESCNPFIRLYTSNDINKKHETSVSSETLNPNYKECFSLLLQEFTNQHILFLEVWNRKERKRFINIKKVNQEYRYDFVGVAKVPLRAIPAAGITSWYNLDKNDGNMISQGMIKFKAKLIAQKSDQICDRKQEYCHLLKILLYRKLMDSHVTAYWWSGQLNEIAKKLIQHHQPHVGLSGVETTFAQWIVYSEVHKHHPLSFELFDRILRNLIHYIEKNDAIHGEHIKTFWLKAQFVLASCFDGILLLRNRAGDNYGILARQLPNVLNLINNLTNSKLYPPKPFDIFEISHYVWMEGRNDGQKKLTLKDAISQVVILTVKNYFEDLKFMTDDSKPSEHESDEQSKALSQLCKVIGLVNSADESDVLMDVIWGEISNILTDLVEFSMLKNRPLLFYQKIKSILAEIVEQSTQGFEKSAKSRVEKSLQNVNKELELCCTESTKLIYQFHMECHSAQKEIKASQLTIDTVFHGNTLEIEIVKADHLKAKDNDHLCDPFVRIHFAPEEMFEKVLKPKTNVIEKSQFPVWKEKFSM